MRKNWLQIDVMSSKINLNDSNENNVNNVFVRRTGSFGILGLGQKNLSHDFSEISELRGKVIEEFFEGNYCMYARTDTNDIYYWGLFEKGQLVRRAWTNYESKSQPKSRIRKEYLKPKKNQFLSDYNIINICFGDYHCLALSSNGKVFGWDNNENGQLGCFECQEYVLDPIFINFDVQNKLINVYNNRCYAVNRFWF